MSRLIIQAEGLPMAEALSYAAKVVEKGRISGRGNRAQYCYVTVFHDKVTVCAFRNKSSDRLVVRR